MLFPTIDFAVFFSLIFPITWTLNRSNRIKKWFLVFSSYFFYGFWNLSYVPILFLSSLFNFTIGLLLGRITGVWSRLLILWFGIGANLSVLIYFKYYNYLMATLMNLFLTARWPINIKFIEVALPVAISFITFHVLAYIIDVYKRRIVPATSLVDIMLYISFFPHLVAGPIIRPKSFLKQVASCSNPNNIKVGQDILLILSGLFKKVLIANYLATDFVDEIFRAPQSFSTLDLLLGMYAYAMQIYCDFSAYTDIAIGIAGLLGYEFPENFNQPYRALTLQDFWRRWHITLSTWLKDYLYIPLGGSRGSAARTYTNILLTMGLGGLWHGANTTFLIWGLMHGLGLVIERMGNNSRWWKAHDTTCLFRAVRWLVTFHFVCLMWVVFRSPSLDNVFVYIGRLFSDRSFTTTISPLVAVMLGAGALTQLIPARLFSHVIAWYDRAPTLIQLAVAGTMLFFISVAAPSDVPPFIYFQF
jgi:alginate O-acetyltransferase complex protein AlgI